jgi:hypothetical protein
MAERIGVSWATVRQLEAGRAPRASTMQACLRALPALSPQDLLPVAETEGALTQDELWDFTARLFGFCADRVEKVLRVTSTGRRRVTVTTTGLRAELRDPSLQELRLGFGRAMMPGQMSSHVASILAKAAETRVKVVRQREGSVTHHLRFPPGHLATGATYQRTHADDGQYGMYEEVAAARAGRKGPFAAGTSVLLLHPARRLTFSVEFPQGYTPPEIHAHAWPEAHVPHGDAMDLLDVLPKFAHAARFDARRARLVLDVTRPMPGIRYSLAWILPRRRP